ncbi:hypothetical protein RHAL1_02381 [Beijerinckiaceae bacterium RH AL1]|nr:DoxX family protein [Beijerinckiaceae bacterium]VVB46613.1 hypothetical protein RHCH11_RHCH11_02335 [Beijerinckiaceae bacterium RH CH11]VVB46698.1 hypothetical protein RHAL8_02331 [Beijerinckiaceae bacterium RH AL8]VVC55463.1 hypothetical protein RHAL1_02381 [Beijerinckiaceae bacterium RH AL1]
MTGIERGQAVARVLSAVVFIPFGLLHIAAAQKFLPIMPPMIPFPTTVVILTGLAEIAGGIGILLPPLRKAAAIGLALYAIGVYPANVYQALWHVHVPPLPDSWWYHAPRLLFQPVFVWWALFASGLTAWPFKRTMEAEP